MCACVCMCVRVCVCVCRGREGEALRAERCGRRCLSFSHEIHHEDRVLLRERERGGREEREGGEREEGGMDAEITSTSPKGEMF